MVTMVTLLVSDQSSRLRSKKSMLPKIRSAFKKMDVRITDMEQCLEFNACDLRLAELQPAGPDGPKLLPASGCNRISANFDGFTLTANELELMTKEKILEREGGKVMIADAYELMIMFNKKATSAIKEVIEATPNLSHYFYDSLIDPKGGYYEAYLHFPTARFSSLESMGREVSDLIDSISSDEDMQEVNDIRNALEGAENSLGCFRNGNFYSENILRYTENQIRKLKLMLGSATIRIYDFCLNPALEHIAKKETNRDFCPNPALDIAKKETSP